MKREKKIKRVLIMAGGTGGHVFPGLVVAHYFRHQHIDVHWLGTSQGLESRLVPEANFPLHLIHIHGLRGKGWKSLLTAPFKIIMAIMQSKRIIKALQPDVVLGMGGFVSGPGGIASWLACCPLIIHEQNAIAGLTNRILACFASKVLQGFPAAFTPKAKVRTIGNPVRHEIECIPSPAERFSSPLTSSPFRLLVLGGSLGAKALNEIVPRALAQLSVEERPVILHQTGEKHINNTIKLYASLGLSIDRDDIGEKFLGIRLLPFIDDMVAAYAFADMVLCRAGALTIAELCAVGVGSILIPFPHAVDDHQTANAQFMVKNGASLCMQQAEFSVDQLVEMIRQFTRIPQERIKMAQAAYQLRQSRVAEKIIEICQEGDH